MIEYHGTIESIRTKIDKTGETKARVVMDISTWEPEELLPELLRLQKSNVAATFREIIMSSEGE